MIHILFIAFFISSCGHAPSARPAYFVGDTEQRVEVILAGQMRNGQHCFYERKIKRAALYGTDSLSSGDAPTPRLELEELGNDSNLLTPRSIYLKDLQSALASRSRSSNIARNLVSWTISPLVMSCYASFTAVMLGAQILPVVAATCGPVVLLSTSVVVAASRASREAKAKVNGVTSMSLHRANSEDMEQLREIFTWLESVDSAACPLQPKLKTSSSKDEKKT